MSDYQKETAFFHHIATAIKSLVESFDGRASITVQKGIAGDYATEVDIAVEQLIVNEIQKRFPGDQILAEEEHSDVAFENGRVWIIDPICGTSNLGRGIRNYCTNIALAINSKLVAACVVDHSQNEYFWSVGGDKVCINDQLFKEPPSVTDTFIEVDFGALPSVKPIQVEKHMRAVSKLLANTDCTLLSLNTSLSFAYVAVGKIDGVINVANNPWDVCAASFLIKQSGGFITDIEGRPWEISSVGFIAAKNKALHAELLEIYAQS